MTFLSAHYRIALSGIMPGVLTTTYPGLNAPKIGDTVKVSIKPEALMLLPEGDVGA